MANGNGNQAVLDFLRRVDGIESLSTKQKNEFVLEGIAIMLRGQISRDAEWADYKAKIDHLEKRSVGLWIYNHPKLAATLVLILYSFAISDIRQPIMDWLGEVAKLLL